MKTPIFTNLGHLLLSIVAALFLAACGGGGDGGNNVSNSPQPTVSILPPIPSTPFEATRTVGYTAGSHHLPVAMQGKIKTVTDDPSGYGVLSFEGLVDSELQLLKMGNILLTPDRSFFIVANLGSVGGLTTIRFRKAFAKEVFTDYKVQLSGSLTPTTFTNVVQPSSATPIKKSSANNNQEPITDRECKMVSLSPSESAGKDVAVKVVCSVDNKAIEVELKFNHPKIAEKGEVTVLKTDCYEEGQPLFGAGALAPRECTRAQVDIRTTFSVDAKITGSINSDGKKKFRKLLYGYFTSTKDVKIFVGIYFIVTAEGEIKIGPRASMSIDYDERIVKGVSETATAAKVALGVSGEANGLVGVGVGPLISVELPHGLADSEITLLSAELRAALNIKGAVDREFSWSYKNGQWLFGEQSTGCIDLKPILSFRAGYILPVLGEGTYFSIEKEFDSLLDPAICNVPLIPNTRPVVTIEPDTVFAAEGAVLSFSAKAFDKESGVRYLWTQLYGPTAELSYTTTESLKLRVPFGTNRQPIAIKVEVTDFHGLSQEGTALIVFKPLETLPPDATRPQVNISSISPSYAVPGEQFLVTVKGENLPLATTIQLARAIDGSCNSTVGTLAGTQATAFCMVNAGRDSVLLNILDTSISMITILDTKVLPVVTRTVSIATTATGSTNTTNTTTVGNTSPLPIPNRPPNLVGLNFVSTPSGGAALSFGATDPEAGSVGIDGYLSTGNSGYLSSSKKSIVNLTNATARSLIWSRSEMRNLFTPGANVNARIDAFDSDGAKTVGVSNALLWQPTNTNPVVQNLTATAITKIGFALVGSFDVSDADGDYVTNLRVHVSKTENGSTCVIDIGKYTDIHSAGKKDFRGCEELTNTSGKLYLKVEAKDTFGGVATVVRTSTVVEGQPIVIASVTPISGSIGELVSVQVTGQNLPDTLIVNIQNQTRGCFSTSRVSTTLATFNCPLSVVGTHALQIKSDIDSANGTVIKSVDFTVIGAAINVSGLAGSQGSAGQPINGSFSVAGSTVSLMRVHAGTTALDTWCYTDLATSTGAKSFSFQGNWTNQNGKSCAGLLPAAGASANIVFKVEARDGAGTLANAGTAPAVGITYSSLNNLTSISNVTPASGRAGSAVTVTVTGTNLPTTLAMNIDGQSAGCSALARGNTQASFSCPLDVVGIRLMEVKTNTAGNGGVVIASSFNAFTVDPALAVVTGITPGLASRFAPTTFTISGTNLPSTLALDVAGLACDNVNKPALNKITCQASSTVGARTATVKSAPGGVVLFIGLVSY